MQSRITCETQLREHALVGCSRAYRESPGSSLLLVSYEGFSLDPSFFFHQKTQLLFEMETVDEQSFYVCVTAKFC